MLGQEEAVEGVKRGEGRVELVTALRPLDTLRVAQSPSGTVVKNRAALVTIFGLFNTRKAGSPWLDVRLRQAANMAINREDLIQSSIVAYIGVNPRDMRWITAASAADAVQTFVDGKADAFFAFAPQGEELRAKQAGRVILNTTQDRPWSQYFCCMVSARRAFAEQ